MEIETRSFQMQANLCPFGLHQRCPNYISCVRVRPCVRVYVRARACVQEHQYDRRNHDEAVRVKCLYSLITKRDAAVTA
jgi:hypothetical protein